MPQGPQYIFAFQNKDREFWRRDPDGTATHSFQPYLLNFSPTGWNDIAIQNIRNKIYKSVDRSVSIPLSHIMDGADILKDIFYKKGNNEKVYFIIGSQRLDFEANPNGRLVFTSGGSPFAPGSTNTGTITGTPGSTVLVRFTWLNPILGDTLTGDFDGVGFSVDYLASPPTFTLIIPVGGVINFNVTFTQAGGSPSVAGMALVNSLGNTVGSYGYWHKMIYKGEIDWSTYDHTGPKVTVTTLEDGLPKYLKANDKTIYEIDMNVPEAVFVKMDGIRLHEKLNYQDITGYQIDFSFFGDQFFTPSFFYNSEGSHVGVLVNSQQIQDVGGLTWDDKINQTNCIIQNLTGQPLVVRLFGQVEYTCMDQTSSPGYGMRHRFIKTGQLIGNQNDYACGVSGGAMVEGQTYTRPFDITLTLQPNEKLYREGIFFGGVGSNAGIEYTDNSKFSIEFITRYQPTYIRALRPQYVFEKLVNLITEGTFTADISDYFEAMKDRVLTCGDAIRELDTAKMKISFETFYKFWNSIDAVGVIDEAGIKVGFEQDDDLYDFANIIDLPEPQANSFKVTMDKEVLINQVNIGFTKIRNDIGALNGNQEFNNDFIFSTETTNVSGVLDRIATIKTSCYEIEDIRIKTVEKKTTDSKTDNDLYALHIESTLNPAVDTIPAHYKLDRSLNLLVTSGLFEPESVFNIWFSPARSFLRMGSFIHGLFFNSDWLNFIFRSADKNSDMVCDGIVEKANRNIGDLPLPKILPILFNMTEVMPEEIIPMLELNPLQVFRFPFQGDIFIGVLEKISQAPSSNALQQIILRSASVNDLKKLIVYAG